MTDGYSWSGPDVSIVLSATFRFVADTRLYLQHMARMVTMWRPLRVLMPFATVLSLIGFAKAMFDLADKSFRIGTNTLLVMAAAGLSFVGASLADLVVHVTGPRHTGLPTGAFEAIGAHDHEPA